MPVVATEKAAACPGVTSWLTGCVVIDGATAVEPLTLRIPPSLVALPALLLTTAENRARLSEVVVGGVVYEEEFAPLTALPFFNHW